MKEHPASRWDEKTNSDMNYKQTEEEIYKIEDKLMREKLSKDQLKVLDSNLPPTDLHSEKEVNLAKDWLMSNDSNGGDNGLIDPDIIKAKNEFLKHEDEIVEHEKEAEKLLYQNKNDKRNKSFIQALE